MNTLYVIKHTLLGTYLEANGVGWTTDIHEMYITTKKDKANKHCVDKATYMPTGEFMVVVKWTMQEVK